MDGMKIASLNNGDSEIKRCSNKSILEYEGKCTFIRNFSKLFIACLNIRYMAFIDLILMKELTQLICVMKVIHLTIKKVKFVNWDET